MRVEGWDPHFDYDKLLEDVGLKQDLEMTWAKKKGPKKGVGYIGYNGEEEGPLGKVYKSKERELFCECNFHRQRCRLVLHTMIVEDRPERHAGATLSRLLEWLAMGPALTLDEHLREALTIKKEMGVRLR